MRWVVWNRFPRILGATRMTTLRKETPKEGRVDYRWRVDRDGGFEKATLIYDREGRLVAMDYEVLHHQEPRQSDRVDQ